MPEPKRVTRAAALDDISDHLGVVLKRADELLAEWSAFGVAVRGQVEREAATVGDAVAHAVDGAVARATAAGIDRAISDHVGARLNALTGELARLEQRARAASRSLSEERAGDRRVLWIVAGGVLVANALLVAMLLRKPPAVAPVAEPARVEWVAPPPATTPVPPDEAAGSAAAEPPAGSASKAPDPAPADPKSPAAAPSKAAPPQSDPRAGSVATPAKSGGGSATPKPTATAPPGVMGASAPAVHVPTAGAKLPPRRK